MNRYLLIFSTAPELYITNEKHGKISDIRHPRPEAARREITIHSCPQLYHRTTSAVSVPALQSILVQPEFSPFYLLYVAPDTVFRIRISCPIIAEKISAFLLFSI